MQSLFSSASALCDPAGATFKDDCLSKSLWISSPVGVMVPKSQRERFDHGDQNYLNSFLSFDFYNALKCSTFLNGWLISPWLGTKIS